MIRLALVLAVLGGCKGGSSTAEPPPVAAKRPALRVEPSADSSQPPRIVPAGPPSGMLGEVEDTTTYRVVMNHEEQYSIWPADRELPLGWRDAGKSGRKDECLAYIKEVWTDMRPLSLRKKLEAAQSPADDPPQP